MFTLRAPSFFPNYPRACLIALVYPSTNSPLRGYNVRLILRKFAHAKTCTTFFLESLIRNNPVKMSGL